MAEARRLAAEVIDPTIASPAKCWNTTWRMPLYANARADVATQWVRRLAPLLDGDWQQLSQDDRPAICRVQRGNTNNAFTLGRMGEELCGVGGLARYRLFAIQAAARALEPLFLESATPFAQVQEWPVGRRVEKMHQVLNDASVDHLGGGPTYWGHVTVAHLLTDFGLGCKPDRQLKGAAFRLRLVGARTAEPPTTLRKIIAVNDAVGELSQATYGDRGPATLRYVDKLLMEFSRQGIVGEPMGGGAPACR